MALLLASPPARAESPVELGVGLDLFTVTAAEGDGRITSFAVVDFLAGWRAAPRWNPWISIGAGLITARARAGVDVYPASRERSGVLFRLAGRYVILTTVASAPAGFADFDATQDYARGGGLEAGVGYRLHRERFDVTIAAVYLFTRMVPVEGGERAGPAPTGAATFHGGTISAAIQW